MTAPVHSETQKQFLLWQGLFVAVYAASLLTGKWLFELSWMSRAASLDGPPWYFIGQDVIDGLACLGGIVVLTVIAWSGRRSAPEASWIALFMGLIFMGYPIGQLVYVVVRSSRIWDPATAATAWPSFDAYIADPVMWVILVALLSAALIIFKRGRQAWASAASRRTNG